MTGRETTYDVRMWGVSKRAWRSGTTYRVRWIVARKEWHDSFTTKALAESFRADLLSLARQGEPFDVATGRPMSWQRPEESVASWYDHACAYVDMKWPHAAGKSRQGIAESLATVTPALLVAGKNRPSASTVRQLLYGWSFNARIRAAGPPEDRLVRVERWVAANTVPVRDLSAPAVLRPALDALALRMDGKPAAASTVSRKRAIFFNALEYAVELGHLPTNPITAIKWRAPKLIEAINPRVVINHGQARALLDAVGRLRPGPALVAFFGVMYYAALRPGEAVDLRKEALTLPRTGWGELFLSTSAPAAGRAWERGRHPARAASAQAPRCGRGPDRAVSAGADSSVDVLLWVYAKCIAGQEDAVRRRVEEALRQGRS